jgi:hypothetical protein
MVVAPAWKPTCVAAAAVVLTACSGFSITQPKDGSTIRLPGATTVVVDASPSMTGLRVFADGADVSGQIGYVSDAERRGNLSLAAGRHAIMAAASVPCWYCAPNPTQLSMQISLCVANQNSTASPSKTALAQADGKTWSKASDATIAVGSDDQSLGTHWRLFAPGLGGSVGIIRSVENDCLCMKSMDALQDTPIGLAICDLTDPLQQWQALQPAGSSHWRLQNNGRAISDACLTEGANGLLVQRACNDTPDQLWSVRDNTTGQTGSPF